MWHNVVCHRLSRSHKLMDQSTGTRRCSRNSTLDEVVVVFHSVNSREFVMNRIVVVLHSINSGGLHDGSTRCGVPPLRSSDICVASSTMSDIMCGGIPLRSLGDKG